MAESAVTPNPIAEYEAGFAVDTRRAGRRALIAAFVGFFVDMFDVYLPTVALGPAMAYFQPDTMSKYYFSPLGILTVIFCVIWMSIGMGFVRKLGDIQV